MLNNSAQIEPLHAWNESRLLATLLSILKQSQIPVAVCMFLDGLDEIDGRYDTVVQMMGDLADHTNVKICLSSRPLPVFEEAFNGVPGLKLQDLTFQSIRAYARFRLSDLFHARIFHDKQKEQQARHVISTIVDRANGVFLWAVIAVRDVRDGLQGIADLDELAQAIDNLPSELESLFMIMLNRIKPAFQRDAARFLQIALHERDRASDRTRYYSLRLTLCSLHLIRSQRELEDAPFVYEKVATSEIVRVCETLKTQVLSHTAGLLELTPGERPRYHDLCPDDQPLLNMDVNFLHRTVRDFLCNNDEARSFLARKGFTEPQVHLAIARGRLAQLAQFLDEIRPEDGNNFPTAYFVFDVALQHVSLAERLVGAAQSDIMRSLIYASYVRTYSVARDPVIRRYAGDTQAFMIDQAWTSADLVGMAAAVGMTLYVCERLDISKVSRGYAPDLPGLNDYCTNINSQVELEWTRPSQSEESHGNVEYSLCASSYRQTLSGYLRLNLDVPMDSNRKMYSALKIDTDPETNSRPRSPWANDALVETYLLSCCSPSCHDLIRVLLHAGANSMAVVGPMSSNIRTDKQDCFWRRWLRFLSRLRVHYVESNGTSEGILLGDTYLYPNLTTKTVFNITKALIACGADVNFTLNTSHNRGDYSSVNLKRGEPRESYFGLVCDATAMFKLEECFGKEPEFRKFAIAIASFIKRPTRRLVEIIARKKLGPPFAYTTRLSPEDCEALWPLLERWELTGYATDFEALQSVMEGVWEAHNPDWDWEEDLDEDLEEESEEDGSGRIKL